MQDVLEVLTEMRELYQGRYRGRPMAEIRAEATEAVAARTGRTRTTIHDALARRLGLRAGEFDAFVDQCFRGNSDGLRQVLAAHGLGMDGRARLTDLICVPVVPSDPPPPDPPRPPRPKPRPIAVVLDEDVAEVFRTSEAVNDALRGLLHLARKVAKRTGARTGSDS
jgi:hypothetical protein